MTMDEQGPSATGAEVHSVLHTNGQQLDIDSDSEYEYEYDLERTEDIYFTLDLSTHDAEAVSRVDLSKIQHANADGIDEAVREEGNNNEADSSSKQQAKARENPAGRLQILDLHSDNALIKLDDSFYSCNWSSELGTQVYVSRPGVAQSPQRPGKVVDVVGLSRARLTGRPVTLHHRPQEATAADINGSLGISEDGGILDDVNAAVAINQAPTAERQIARFKAAQQTTKDPAVKAQASFLERLSAIKRKKGETDIVPFLGVKHYNAPTNKEELRQAALELDSTKTRNGRRAKRLKRPLKGSGKAAAGRTVSQSELLRPLLGGAQDTRDAAAIASPAVLTHDSSITGLPTSYAAFFAENPPNHALASLSRDHGGTNAFNLPAVGTSENSNQTNITTDQRDELSGLDHSQDHG